ncbi:protein TANC2 isoform X2 [Lepeophtheirus salmonis]|uniref:protein TANC2 isoform X2 n=1 Tax=Lepeophtheirus salmonis TaxID=72036 RepID=UPI001AE90ACA|nr:protein TANC2-like isoform X2 [Lepeophtheirus salmonis]
MNSYHVNREFFATAASETCSISSSSSCSIAPSSRSQRIGSELPPLRPGSSNRCPSCNLPFNNSNKRKLIDSNCGHAKCYACMFKNQKCLLCQKGAFSRNRFRCQSLRGSPVPSTKEEEPIKRRSICNASSESGFQSYNTSMSSLEDRNAIRRRIEDFVYGGAANGGGGTEDDLLSSAGGYEDREMDRESMVSGQSSFSELRPSSVRSMSTSSSFFRNNQKRHSMISWRKLKHSTGSSSMSFVDSASYAAPKRTFQVPNTLKEEDEENFNNTLKKDSKRLQYPLKTLYFGHDDDFADFDVVGPGEDLVNRRWVFTDSVHHLGSDLPTNAGIIISGLPGTGKTALVKHMIRQSSFGRKGCKNARKLEPPTTVDILSSSVIAYHFCQSYNAPTCSIPEFVHSLASLLFQSVIPYRQVLLDDPDLQKRLSLSACLINPRRSFVEGILLPLKDLFQDERDLKSIVIDGLDEAEIHRTDNRETISTFISDTLPEFPPWLKVIVTLNAETQEEIQKLLPFHRLSLDRSTDDERVMKDVSGYVSKTIKRHEDTMMDNIRPASYGIWRPTSPGPKSPIDLLISHFLGPPYYGNILFIRLTLDLISRNFLKIKSSNLHVLPISLSQIYLLEFNLKFPSSASFEPYRNILSVLVTPLNPLTVNSLYQAVITLESNSTLSMEEFKKMCNFLNRFLMIRNDDTIIFRHTSFRNWLIRRNNPHDRKYLCDPRMGHAGLARRLIKMGNLGPEPTLELGHHVLKANMFRPPKSVVPTINDDAQSVNETDPINPYIRSVDVQAIQDASENLDAALSCPRNLMAPNIVISRLLLICGADPNSVSPLFDNAPILGIFSRKNYPEMVALLLKFGADVNKTNERGQTPLLMHLLEEYRYDDDASAEILDLLILQHNCDVKTCDSDGQTPLSVAAHYGHIKALEYILPYYRDLSETDEESLQNALVAACISGQIDAVESLLRVSTAINGNSVIHGETPLTAASKNGHDYVVAILLRREGLINVNETNLTGYTPMQVAIKNGHWAIVELLMKAGSVALDKVDSDGRSCLMMASMNGDVNILEFLLSNLDENILNLTDSKGYTALHWAVMSNKATSVSALLARNASIEISDKEGQSPLHKAASLGLVPILKLLLEPRKNESPDLNAYDNEGLRPVDRAIMGDHVPAIMCFLKKGAKLGQSTWTLAKCKPSVLLILLNKLLEDGNVLFSKGRLSDSSHRYEYALKRLPSSNDLNTFPQHRGVFLRVKVHLLLNLSRSRRKNEEFAKAIDAASSVLDFQNDCYQAYWYRAKAIKDAIDAEAYNPDDGKPWNLDHVINDLTEAVRLEPQDKDLTRFTILVKTLKNKQNSSNNNYEAAAGGAIKKTVAEVHSPNLDKIQALEIIEDDRVPPPTPQDPPPPLSPTPKKLNSLPSSPVKDILIQN